MGREDLRPAELHTAFERVFDAPPELEVRPPGRVDLIGQHTGYDDGSTLPVALDRGTDVAVGRRPDGLLRTVARELDATDTRPIDALRPAEGRSGPATSPGRGAPAREPRQPARRRPWVSRRRRPAASRPDTTCTASSAT